MPEGLSATEVGKEIAEHTDHHAAHGGNEAGGERHDRWISLAEAVILSFVAVLAAYSGYAAAKWGTESSLSLARASALRTKASQANLEAIVTRTADSASFNAWFTAFVAGNAKAERIAERRLRPGYGVAFDAWLATDPAHNPNAPLGPAYMPQYVIPQQATSNADNAKADQAFAEGESAGGTEDKYIRDTVFLATVLFPGRNQRPLSNPTGALRPRGLRPGAARVRPSANSPVAACGGARDGHRVPFVLHMGRHRADQSGELGGFCVSARVPA